MIQEAITNYKLQHTITTLSPLKAILFDMDGVIFDSMPYHALSWVNAFKQVGITFSEYEVYLNEGRTGASTIHNEFLSQKHRQASDAEIKELYALKSQHFEACGKPIAMNYATETLDRVKHLGLDIFLVTGSGQVSLLNTLNTYFPEVFSKQNMVTAYDVTHGKPHPEPYLIALEKGNLQAQQAFVVENAPLGIQAAVAANIFTVAVNTGILEDKVLLEAGANIVVPSLADFYHLLPSLVENWK
ncbi:MAG: HAD-IA family hydrolase [Paludibacteraceae bacterium]|nr:HAD-IA family hydrolase [Paludibacteraceae bacterium]MBP8782114.1 HAD-IA family hydrolase [Paludibacteraceae bacterium]